MAKVSFYHLTRFGLEEALPALLEKVLKVKGRAFVLGVDEKRMKELDAHLWTYTPSSFLPHGLLNDPHAEDQPVLLSTVFENKNQADYLFLIDGAQMEDFEGAENVFILFNGRDDDALALARKQYTLYKSMQHTLRYFQQTPSGGWEKKE